MILKCPLDGLVEKVWSEKFIYIRLWEVGCERLTLIVSARLEAGGSRTYQKVGDNPVVKPQ